MINHVCVYLMYELSYMYINGVLVQSTELYHYNYYYTFVTYNAHSVLQNISFNKEYYILT